MYLFSNPLKRVHAMIGIGGVEGEQDPKLWEGLSPILRAAEWAVREFP